MKGKIDCAKIKIMICCHKPCELPKDDVFLPIQVGAAISDLDLGMQRDDQVSGKPCDNISAKNKSYCELTAMYWAWKNIKKLYPDLEYIGLNHYRRYFALGKRRAIKDLFIQPERAASAYILNYGKLRNSLQSGRAIVAKKKIYPYPLYIDYSVCHVSDDLRTLEKVIAELHPDYQDAFKSVLMRNNALAPYNMTVIGWNDFASYCEWLFSVLLEAEKRINIQNYSDVQKRIFGYMAERLFNVWLYKNKITIKEIPVVQYADNVKEYSALYYIYRNIRFWLSAKILTSWRKSN